MIPTIVFAITVLVYLRSMKYLHKLEHAFLMMAFLYFFTTASDLAVQFDIFRLTKRLPSYLACRLNELAIPMIILIFIDRGNGIRSYYGKIAAFCGCTVLLWGNEQLVIRYGYYQPNRWTWWISILSWFCWIGLMYILHKLYRVFWRRSMNEHTAVACKIRLE